MVRPSHTTLPRCLAGPRPAALPCPSTRSPPRASLPPPRLPPRSPGSRVAVGAHARRPALACFAAATVASSRVHGRSSFGAFVDKKSSCTLGCGRKCLVLPSITYNELLGPVRG